MNEDVWVVCGNDYPAAVFSSEEKAEHYIELKNLEQLDEHGKIVHRIYWHSYEFVVDGKL